MLYVTILCQLETYFLPSSFDIMVHLIVFLVGEIIFYGPVYLRSMYPIKRYMNIFKEYTKNHHRPEASFVERHITKEVVEFYSNYLPETESIRIQISYHDDRYEGRGTQGLHVKSMARDIVLQEHLYILNNVDEVKPYLSSHKKLTKEKYSRMSDKWLLKGHNKNFISWFNKRIYNDDNVSNTIKWMLYMPKFNLVTWIAYDISKFSFYTKSKDYHSKMQNTRVMVEVESIYFSSLKDNSHILHIERTLG